ncbi:response regulator transcription factor [Paraburkholderia sp. JHI869]|uniref:response regulator transcription factor n=1 Tax=Paraburkholderia sp. JHI869 TaxID=3112959 RepID=UPI00316D138E
MRIAVLGEDAEQTGLVFQSLVMDGHACRAFAEGRELVKHLRLETFDLLVLDWNVPDMPGEEVLRSLRQSLCDRLPVLFMTCRSCEADIASLLDEGADDYVVKPITTNILRVRVRSLRRRADQRNDAKTCEIFGEFKFDVASKKVVVRGIPVTLTRKGFELALLLFRHLGQPLSRAYLLESVWKRSIDMPSRTMDTHVSMLRTRLGLRPENGYRLMPVYGYGYQLERIEVR